jgi:O-antigen ligase
MTAWWPAALFVLFAAWCGSFFYGAGGVSTSVGHLTLLAIAAWGWRDGDPLQLGRRGRWLPLALWALAALSAATSPVPRAGAVGLLLAPALVVVPAAVARAWGTVRQARRGVSSLAVAIGALALAALLLQRWQGSAKAAQPLGHHLLLALCLAVLLPLSLVPALAARRWGARVGWLAAPALAMAALFASGSLAGTAGGLFGLASLLRGRLRFWVAPLAVLALALATQRLVFAGVEGDSSWAARTVYWRAAAAGAAERPWLGWGPGSTPWTVGKHVRPVPGTSPPGEVVGDLHSLPAQLAYELGAAGTLGALAIAVVWWRRRTRTRPPDTFSDLIRRSGLGGLGAGLVALVATPTFATTAPWVALAIAAGAAQAGGQLGQGDAAAAAAPRSTAWRGGLRPGTLYALLALVGLARLDLAHLAYDRARAAPPTPTAEVRRHLERAVALDPGHPLYRARLGWLAPAASGERAAALRLASDEAPGFGAFALAAGAAALDAGEGDPAALLGRACATDPLSARAPFLLATAAPGRPGAAVVAARAFLADPRLVAAMDWERHPGLVTAAAQQVRAWSGVDRGYRRDLAAAITGRPAGGPAVRLVWSIDDAAGRPGGAPSLIAFRRLPWPRPTPLASVLVRREGARALGAMPAATSLPTSAAAAFPPNCGSEPPRSLGGNPQELRRSLWKTGR